MRNTSNISDVVSISIDYIGFIFYTRSPRVIEHPPQVSIPHHIQQVGVFVNQSFNEICTAADLYQLNVIQLHGSETPQFCSKIRKQGYEVMKAIPVLEPSDLTDLSNYTDSIDYLLFDTKTAKHGGSGKKFDWKHLEAYNGEIPFFLSGGIQPRDAQSIKSIDHPAFFGIDLNSGFEESPGLKKATILKEFIHEVQC